MAAEKPQQTLRRPPQAALASRIGPRELALFALAASVLLSLLLTVDLLSSGPGLRSRISPGDIAEQSYKAPADLTLVDYAATDELRRRATEQAPVVYDHDANWGRSLRERIDAAFSAGRTASRPVEGSAQSDPIEAFNSVLELDTSPPEAVAKLLLSRRFADADQSDLLRGLRPVLERSIVDDLEKFRREPEKRRVVVRELGSGVETVLAAPEAVLGLDVARELVGEEVARALHRRPRRERDALQALAEQLVVPNFSFNLRATDERRQAAAASVKEVTITLRKGEIIVRDGNAITQSQLQILEGIREQFRTADRLRTSLGLSALIFALLLATWKFGRGGIQRFPSEPRDALFLLGSLVAVAVGTKLAGFVGDAVASHPDLAPLIQPGQTPLDYAIPIAAGAMLVRLVQSAETAALFALVAALLGGLQVGGEISYALYTLVASLVAAAGASRVTQRSTLLRAGAQVGAVNMGMVLAVTLLQGQIASVGTLIALGAGFLGGCLAGGMVSALAPLVESIFGYTTDVKLLEMANREQPLLRELEIRAPGTYHHSMMVGHLAEKAAEAIGANGLLAKVGGYYHDIGKMRRPHFFVENVTVHHGENRHESLSPSMSARIIQAHVKDGLELGRQYKLAPPIMRGIGEHHGTSIIRFFYEKAKELIDPEKGEFVEEQQYRYPGPKPQTREAGTLMLADSVEAASRTLADTSPARIQQLVQRTINNYFRDGQLDDCSLTLRDLNAIARSFIDTLSAIRHERIDYPETTDAEGRKLDEDANEGVVERLEPRKKDRSEGTPEKREDDLKRLGLS